MKKSEIIRNIINDDCYYYTKHSVIEIVNFIFYEHEAQLKAKDDEIELLKSIVEEAMKPKTCKGCVREAEDMQDQHCAFCSRACNDIFEPKDTQC